VSNGCSVMEFSLVEWGGKFFEPKGPADGFGFWGGQRGRSQNDEALDILIKKLSELATRLKLRGGREVISKGAWYS